jgi:hypothetical protein
LTSEGGWNIWKNNFLQAKEKEKKIMQHTIDKNKYPYHAKESVQKKILHVTHTEISCKRERSKKFLQVTL